MQLKGNNRIHSLEDAREVVRHSFDLLTYLPRPEMAQRWQEAYENRQYLTISP